MANFREALEQRRGRGVDIQLIIGNAEPITASIPVEAVTASAEAPAMDMEEEGDQKDSDLAPEGPEVAAVEQGDEGPDKDLLPYMKQAMGKDGLRAKFRK